MDEQPNQASTRSIDDVACTVCACVCDDLRVTVLDGRIVDYQPFCSRVGNWFAQQNSTTKPAALHLGQPIPLDEAVNKAAEILKGSVSPLIYGLSQSSTDGQREAVALADRLGANIDTTASEGHAPSIMALQQVGESTCSLGEIRNRADLIIYWGSDPIQWQPRHIERFASSHGNHSSNEPKDRTIIVIDSEETATTEQGDVFLKIDRHSDFDAIWTLRGLLGGYEPLCPSIAGQPLQTWKNLAERMKSCRCGIVFFGYGLVLQGQGNHNVEALLRLVTDLNQYTRFYARRMRIAGDVSGADGVLCWQTGYPFAVNFSRGYPRYNPGEYSAADLLERGETDAAILIGSSKVDTFPAAALGHLKRIPTILLEHPFGTLPFTPTLRFATDVYGVHRHGTAYRMDEVPIPLRPILDSVHPSDDEILNAIYKALD
jgi:formylmethanofuran dehydrogenase subunit B